jgi:hypothetical protein
MVMRAGHLQDHQASITGFLQDDSAPVVPLAKIGLGDLLAPGKSPQVSLLEANFPNYWQNNKNVPENILLS